MRSLSLNLPKYRLHLHLVKRRGVLFENPILPKMEDIQKVKKGHKISRFFRHVFEHRSIKRLLGANLTLMLIASSFVPVKALGADSSIDNIVVEDKVSLTTNVVVQYPVEKVKITQGYRAFHPGLDLDGLTGDEIRPIEAGIVDGISRSSYAYGNAVLVNHGEGVSSLYAHLSKIMVSEGEIVGTDTIIGTMGATGRASGDHLHLEVRSNGIPVNPYTVLPRL